jgi:hypothetical protein
MLLCTDIKFDFSLKGRTWIEGVQQKGAEERIWN